MTAKLEIKIDMTVARAIINNTPKAAEAMLRAMAQDMTKDIKSSMGTGGDYREWPSKRAGGGKHWSAPPYQPPNPDTNQLKASIAYANRGNLTFDIHDGVEYGVYQEMGTTSGGWGGTGHRPRPFMRPVFRKYGRADVLVRYARRAGVMQK